MIQISANLRIFKKLSLTRKSLAHRHAAESQHPKLRKEKFSIASLWAKLLDWSLCISCHSKIWRIKGDNYLSKLLVEADQSFFPAMLFAMLVYY